jgi:hypothetical protein
MRRTTPRLLAIGLAAALATTASEPEPVRAGGGCTGGCGACVPACSGTWEEKKTTKPRYSMTCEQAGVRGRDPWHAPADECRCHPPCGQVIVKKRFFKAAGPETVERVPKYEVHQVAAEACDHTSGHGESRLCWWNPLAILQRCTSWW